MTKIITLANQKGGVGKTTLAQAIGNAKRIEGHKVLFIDLDQQSNLTWSLDGNALNANADIFEVIVNQANISDAIVETAQGDLIQSNSKLMGIDAELQSIRAGREYRLTEAIESIKGGYDYIIIDTPPQSSQLVINALTASDYLIVPAEASIFSIQAISQIDDVIHLVKRYTNPQLDFIGIVLNLFNDRTVLSKEIQDMTADIASRLDTKVFQSTIRKSVVIDEAHANKKSIFDYAPNSKVASDLNALIKELNI